MNGGLVSSSFATSSKKKEQRDSRHIRTYSQGKETIILSSQKTLFFLIPSMKAWIS